MGVLAVGVAAPVEAQFLSPGELSRDHASLDGDTRCSECHSEGAQVSTSACGRCHADVARTIAAGTGLHGRQYRGRGCGGCHVEHRGRGHTLVRWPGGMEGFDHALTGWPLRGDHRQAECRDCHRRANSRGHATFLGAPRECGGCHEDPHANRFGNQCSSCHSELSWFALDLARFDHSRARFPLRGSHQQVQCAQCHGTPPRYVGLQFSTCASCHADPHRGRFGTDCASCHAETGWNDLHAIRENHPGVSLGGGHSRLSCEGCHDRGIDNAPRAGSQCVSCHRPVHEAEFGNNCARCHRGIRWLGLQDRVGREAHAQTPFPLRGAHESVECSSCHRENLPRAERYRGLAFDECKSCHEDVHGGAFAAHDGGECGACHDERAFAPSRFTPALHGTHTGYPLVGFHANVACNGCHRNERPRIDWHIEGRHECASCHENPHGDQFAAEMRRGGCASCHSPTGWNRPNIDHSSWPLTGVHETTPCESCHSPTEADRRSGSGASYRGVPRACDGCHEDVHAGQFRTSDPVRACDFCHSTAAFRIPRFDHARIADYPLTGRHSNVECRSCHATVEFRHGAGEAVRYRLGYRECSDCHANPHAGGPR